MGFQQHRKVHLLGQALPAFDQAGGLGLGARAHIGLQGEVVAAVAADHIQCRRQVVDALREQLAFDLQAPRRGGGVQARDIGGLPVVIGNAIETGGLDAVELGLHRAGLGLHRPQGLEYQKLTHISLVVGV